MAKLQKVTVVIPCYNEAKSIGKVITQFPVAQLRQQGFALHVLVIDNNSSDNTAAVAKKAGAEVLYEPRRGKGNALRTGFAQVSADTDFVVMLDGDNTYDSGEIIRLLEPLRTGFSDVVVGSRLCGRIQTDAMPRLNRLGNQLFTIAARLLYGINITDALTGYFAWRKPALDELLPYIQSPGFAVEMEMITKIARLGHRIVAVPISYHFRSGCSNLRPVRDGTRILSMMCRNLLWRPVHKKRMFMPRTLVFVSDSVYPYMKGGKEKRLYEITRQLAAMGHEVHIYTMHWWPESEKIKQEQGVYLHAICKKHEMYHGDRRAIKEAILFSLACFKLLRVRFDVLDVDHMPFFPIFTTWIVCKLRGRKLYATWHEALSRQEWTSYMRRGGIIASIIERMCTYLPHCITAASAQTKESLATIHGRDQRVALVASGINVAEVSSAPSATLNIDVLYVGRLVKDKHVDMLVEAVNLIAKQKPGVNVVIIGQGPERKALEERVAHYDLQKNITFLEPLPEARAIYAYMKAARVFCLPSVREGFGIVALEALGCGTPVVTVDSPGNAARHLIQPGQNGSVVPLTPDAIAEALVQWISTAQKPGIAAQAAANDWQQLAQQQAEVYLS